MNKFARLPGAISWLFTEHIRKTDAEATYNLVSRDSNYDKIIGYNTRRDALKKLVSGLDMQNKEVLDIACGSGAFIDAVLGMNPKSVIGIDLSEGMLRLAKERFKTKNNVKLIHKSFMDITFGSKSFDYILLANASRYIPKGREAEFFINIKQWLKPYGLFIILSDNIFGTSPLGKFLVSIFYNLGNGKNINKKTSLEWNMVRELAKYFSLQKIEGVGLAWHGQSKHTAYFCRV